MSAWREAVAVLCGNVWAPIGATYHHLAIDTPAISMSTCGLVVSGTERVIVEKAAQFASVVHSGVQCAACRLRAYYSQHVEQPS